MKLSHLLPMRRTALLRLPIFLSLSLLCALTPGRAQRPGDPAGAASRLESMKERLGLSEEQVGQLKPIVQEEAAKLKTLKEDTSLTDTEKKEKAREIMSGVREKLGAILTPEQKAKAAEEMRSRGGGRPAGGDEAAQRLAAMKEKLSLTDEQVEKLKPILAEEAPKMRALRDDKNISQEDRRQHLRQSMERIAAELTPEQREKMREQVQRRKP